MRACTLCVVALAAVLAARAEPARACSCALDNPRAALARADAAFIGTVVERREPPVVRRSADEVTLVFRVERSVKGALGDTVEVKTAASSASCGIELGVGQRTGLFLDRRGAGWLGSLCAQISPARLVEAARPLPAPNGSGSAALLVGGAFGPARTIALDRFGRTLVYGRGSGETQMLAVCPGARRAAEAYTHEGAWSVAVRALPSLRVLRSRRLPSPGFATPAALGCADAAGAGVYVLLAAGEFPQRTRLVRAGPRRVATVWRGTATAGSFAGGLAFVNRGVRGRDVGRLDLAARRMTAVARVPPYTGPLTPSPDGRLLAGVAYSATLRGTSSPSRVVLVDRARRSIRTAPLVANATGSTAWLPGGGLAYFPSGEPLKVRVYDRTLRVRARIRQWQGRGAAVVGATAYGIGWRGELVRAPLPSGPVRRVRTLPSPVAYAIAAVR